MTPEEREELRRLQSAVAEGFRDMVAELRELRRLVEHPAAVDHAARLFLALANFLSADDTYFDKEEPFEWARDDAELSAALEALGLHEPADLGYWLRSRKGAESAGYRIVRDGRGWRMEPASR